MREIFDGNNRADLFHPNAGTVLSAGIKMEFIRESY